MVFRLFGGFVSFYFIWLISSISPNGGETLKFVCNKSVLQTARRTTAANVRIEQKKHIYSGHVQWRLENIFANNLTIINAHIHIYVVYMKAEVLRQPYIFTIYLSLHMVSVIHKRELLITLVNSLSSSSSNNNADEETVNGFFASF